MRGLKAIFHEDALLLLFNGTHTHKRAHTQLSREQRKKQPKEAS